MRGFVRLRGDRWELDERANYPNLVGNQIVLTELVRFLEETRRVNPGARVLDLGAGSKPYEPLYSHLFADCTSVDVPYSPHDTESVDVMASADALPFEDGSFDCVICTEVLEHCPDPAAVMREIARTLRPGGGAFLTTPFLVPLHEMPHDYYRYTPSGLRYLAGRAGLDVMDIRPRGSYLSVWMTVNQMPLTRSMSFISSRTGLPFSHPFNPLLLAFVVLPQKAYLLALTWLAGNPRSRIARLHEKLTYYSGGYVTILRKT